MIITIIRSKDAINLVQKKNFWITEVVMFLLQVHPVMIADWFTQDMPPHAAKQSSAILPRIMKE